MPDREKVIKGLEQCKEGGSCDGCQFDIQSSKCIFLLHEDALALLKEQPQIVRCKDCKHGGCRTTYTDGRLAKVVCKLHGTKKNEVWMDAEWFCADGERKGETE